MSSHGQVVRAPQPSAVELALIEGDLSRLTAEERLLYYNRVCESLGLNPLTRPFEYLRLNGRLILYARRNCTDQLRNLHGISITIVEREFSGGLYIVAARATTPSGRTDEAIGVASVEGLKGEALANALMKTETKAKRRVTLSICGLGWLDETEVQSIPGAQPGENQTIQIVPETTSSCFPLPGAGNGAGGGSQQGNPVTEPQRKKLYVLARELGLDREAMIQLMQDRYQVDSSTRLTKDQASDLIDHLTGLAQMDLRGPTNSA